MQSCDRDSKIVLKSLTAIVNETSTALVSKMPVARSNEETEKYWILRRLVLIYRFIASRVIFEKEVKSSCQVGVIKFSELLELLQNIYGSVVTL